MITFNQDEKIYLIKRRHRIVLAMWIIPEILIFFLIILGMIALFFVSLPSWPEILVSIFPEIANYNIKDLLLFFLSLLLSIFWLIIFITFTNYYLDSWIITNERTIHTELRSLFSRFFSSVSHDRIQDITVDVHGFLASVFHFGDIHIQTAGEFREFIFRQISDPNKTKEIIFEAKREFLDNQKNKEGN